MIEWVLRYPGVKPAPLPLLPRIHEQWCSVIGKLRIAHIERLRDAGANSCHRMSTGHEALAAPRKQSIAHSWEICNTVRVTGFELGNVLEQFDCTMPAHSCVRSLSCECDPKSGQHVQDEAVPNAQHAVISDAGTFADDNGRQSLGHLNQWSQNTAPVEPGSRKAAYEQTQAVGYVLTTREDLCFSEVQ